MLNFSMEIILLSFDKIKYITLMVSIFAKNKIFPSWPFRIKTELKPILKKKRNKEICCRLKNVLKILFKERKYCLH